jgi:phage terminase small subunit
MSEFKFTAKERLFAKEYLVDLNASQAAQRAGYKGPFNVIGAQLLAKPKIQALIQKSMNERVKRVEINADRVLERLDTIGDVDIAEVFNEKGYMLDVHSIPPEVRRCIKSIEVFEEFEGFGKDRVQVGVIRKITFWDKVKANELIGKHMKLWVDRLEVDNGDGRAERIQRARERALKDRK